VRNCLKYGSLIPLFQQEQNNNNPESTIDHESLVKLINLLYSTSFIYFFKNEKEREKLPLVCDR